MIHVHIVIVHALVYEIILFEGFCHLSNAIAIAILLDLDSVHLHLKSIVDVSDVVPGGFYE